VPRPAPSPAELFASELARRASGVTGGLGALGRAARDPRGALASLRDAAEGVVEAVGAGLRPASPTPLNVAIGPHRRFDWTRFDLAAVKEVKNRLGGTVNDVVLATVTGALRQFLGRRGEDVAQLDFRAMVPVNVRADQDVARMGNRVAMVVARLPLGERGARARLRRVIETTRALKASKQRKGVEVLEELADWTSTTLFAEFARMTAVSRPYNIVVTNVPGPQFGVDLLGAPMRAVYPLVPLYRNQALGIALFSYDGGLYWGFNADWDTVPDLHDLVGMTTTEFEKLCKAASAGETAG
jgi:WS/DGAT/MGAT family acyltransferase